jgi:hypothetical protein
LTDTHPATLLVQLAETRWTTDALQVALDHAGPDSRIVLALMLHDSFLAWQGATPDEYHLSDTEQEEVAAFQAQASAHGVPLEVRAFGYHDLAEGLAKAADSVQADIVLATLPAAAIPFYHDREMRHLDHLLNAHQHHLYLVEEPAAHGEDWRPEATPASDDDPPLDEDASAR